MYLIFKRIIDLLLATAAILILSPLFSVVILILLLTGEHEIFYFQKRIGYKNKPFYIWKFATMLKNSSKMGTGEITVRNDPRVTPFGKFLRLSKINELPQLFNILQGDMSIVGPRPLMKVSFDLYSNDVQAKIYNTRPGITGIGSLVFREEEKLLSEAKDAREMYATIYPYKAELECWYLDNASLLVDFKIILLTALSIVYPHNGLAHKYFKDLPASKMEFAA